MDHTSHTPKSKIAQALRLLADALELDETPTSTVWIDHTSSPLGRRRHCAATRRRIEQGLPGAAIVGRAHRLTSEALAEELASVSRAHVPARLDEEPPSVTVTVELERELQLVGVGR